MEVCNCTQRQRYNAAYCKYLGSWELNLLPLRIKRQSSEVLKQNCEILCQSSNASKNSSVASLLNCLLLLFYVAQDAKNRI